MSRMVKRLNKAKSKQTTNLQLMQPRKTRWKIKLTMSSKQARHKNLQLMRTLTSQERIIQRNLAKKQIPLRNSLQIVKSKVLEVIQRHSRLRDRSKLHKMRTKSLRTDN